MSFSYNTAGRMTSLSSTATPYASAAGVSSMAYAAHGGLSSETYSSNLVHAITYNSRLQPIHITLGTVPSPTSKLDIGYGYGSATTNNGNVRTISYAGGGLSYTQDFDYDQLNRLTIARENNGASWTETNAYDRYGNRWTVSGGVPSMTFDANNRITGFTYDKAGNLKNWNSLECQYDAENRQTNLQMEFCCDGPSSTAVYDGEGNRVKRTAYAHIIPAPPVNEFRFVYDMFGRLISEYNAATGALSKETIYGANGLVAAIEPANGTEYVTPDHLGSPRVVTNASQGVVSRHDYMPFGEELSAYIGGRTPGMGYGGSDGVRQQFTQKERDSESGLDYFLARYYSSAQGRFTSCDPYDPITRSEDEDDFKAFLNQPQSWNRYPYTINNPSKYVDPNGERWFYQTDDKGQVSNLEWVNPNEDGSYTSPGEGWTEFVPTSRNPYLWAWNPGFAGVYLFGENSDGSPNARYFSDGGVSDHTMELVVGGLITRGVGLVAKAALSRVASAAARALASWGGYTARRAIEKIFKDAWKLAGKDACPSGGANWEDPRELESRSSWQG